MERISRFCTNCGGELDEGTKFCAQCGTPIRQEAAPAAASEVGRQRRGEAAPTAASEVGKQRRGEAAPAAASEIGKQRRREAAPAAASEIGKQRRRENAPAAASKDWSRYSRFLRVDPSGGFLAVVTPLFIWTAAAGILVWAILGLVSLRFDLSFLNLEDLFLTMVILMGIMLSVVANTYLTLSYRDRAGALWQALSFLPTLWAVFLCVGLSIMIWQVWTDFAGGPNELRRAMFSLVGVGLCGTYGGYLSLVVIGSDRIYHAVRRAVYVLIAIIAVEILDALWWGTGHLSGAELGEHFVRAGGTAITCFIVYSIIAFFMAQARSKKRQIGVLVAYVVFGLIGFTIAVGSLWDSFPPGAIRFVHGAIVIVTVGTIGLLLAQRFHKMGNTGNPTADNAEATGQSSPTTAS